MTKNSEPEYFEEALQVETMEKWEHISMPVENLHGTISGFTTYKTNPVEPSYRVDFGYYFL